MNTQTKLPIGIASGAIYVTDNNRGIEVTGTGSLIIKNTAAANTTACQIAASNRFGPVNNITSAGVAAQAITDGSANVGSSLGSTDPCANFSHRTMTQPDSLP